MKHSATTPIDRPLAGIALRLIAVLMLGLMFAAAKLAEARGAHFVEILFWRQGLAMPIAFVTLMGGAGLAGLHTARPGAHVRRMMVGLTGMACNFGAVMMLPLAEASAFGFTVPIFATILSALVLREPTGAHRWAAVAMGFLGVLIVLQPGGSHVAPAGAAVALTGAVLTATVTILLRDLSRTERTPTIVFWFSATSLIPLGIMLPFVWSSHDAGTWALLLATGIAGGLGQLALTASLRLAPVATVMPMDYSALIWSTLLGLWLFGTLPSPWTWIGAPIIIASGLYIVWREHRLRRAETPAAID